MIVCVLFLKSIFLGIVFSLEFQFTKLEISVVVLNLFIYSLNLFKYLCGGREMTKANGESFEN